MKEKNSYGYVVVTLAIYCNLWIDHLKKKRLHRSMYCIGQGDDILKHYKLMKHFF